MNTSLSLGIIGLSSGNGHPYSWSAIFNGYNPVYMKDCGFPVIPEYLGKQSFPEDCIRGAKVSHIWTQDINLSKHVAQASNIKNVVTDPCDMIGHVDAILLARDDAENHFAMAKPFIESGLPIYIDKPLATSRAEAEAIFSLQKYPGQIFSCSALSYSDGVHCPNIGTIRYIDACVIKDWKKYAIHVIEPTLRLFDFNLNIESHTVNDCATTKTVCINWENGLVTTFKVLGDAKCGFRINIYGTEGSYEINFGGTFQMFKNALVKFISIVRRETDNDSHDITMKAIEIIERGSSK